jgi:GrpB-like predicted nucleotidyltransferase (UPF0157 family)
VPVGVDEPIEISEYDPRWATWYAHDAAELRGALGKRLRELEHFGSTAVTGLAAKPVIDILVSPVEWPLAGSDQKAIEALGYEYLGEAGVAGREYFRRRTEHSTNLAVVEWGGALWNDNVVVRDYLRARPDAAARYAEAKRQAWQQGARTLLSYSSSKSSHVASLLADARQWRGCSEP